MFIKRKKGQGMTEYIILVALIAIALIAVITIFGKDLKRMFGNATDQLGGKSGTSALEGNTHGEDASDITMKQTGSGGL